jgi:hypothetical protein
VGGTLGPPTGSELPDFSGTPGAAAAALLGGADGVIGVTPPCPAVVDGVRRIGPASAQLVIKNPIATTKTDNEIVGTGRLEQESEMR